MRKRSVTPDREEDHNFVATLRKGTIVIRDVVCKVWLPRRVTDEVVMRLYPRQGWRATIGGLRPPFAIDGKVRGFSRQVVTSISATEVWTQNERTRSHGRSRSETIVDVDPIDLRVVHKQPREKATRRRMKVHTNYLLTQCPPLAPSTVRDKSYTGEIKMEDAHEVVFTLANGVHLRFTEHYRYEDRNDGELIYPELVATHEHEVLTRDFARVDERTLDQLDDFLALVGFGARYRTACLGIASSSEHADSLLFYRKDITVPPVQEWDSNHSVIDRADFVEFLSRAYEQFMASGPDDLLVNALHVVAPFGERTGESEFTALYAALESIVLWYRKRTALEFIIDDDVEWRRVQDDVRSMLKDHDLLRGNEAHQKERRGMIQRNVEALRRVPFAVALKKFCEKYAVNLDDLWPVVDNQRSEMSLTDIRNHLVHGRTLTTRQFHALIGAKQHMRWVVERSLLAIFGWPLERSKVRPDFLARNLSAMIELRQDRQDMSAGSPRV